MITATSIYLIFLNNYMQLGFSYTQSSFQTIASTHVLEIVFLRRHAKKGSADTRRMLCTLCKPFLNSMAGRITLNFRTPTHPPPYIAKAYNLCVTWDILWQDWRAIPIDAIEIVNQIPVATKKQQDEFWKYFEAVIKPMSGPKKKKFMDGY